MRDRELHHLTIAEAARLIESRSLSPVELTQTYLERIERLDANLGAYITVMADSALAQASRAESEIANGGYRGRMHGIPIAVKDIIYTRGVLTSAGSRVLADHVPDYDSTIVERLDDAGSVLLGKLNLSEFAVGGTIDHPYGTPRNPWDTGKSAGGSSSGSAVAVAGGLCAGSLGSDTGGSIRGPSAFCGIVGLRPTYGRVTRYGVIPMSWSLDTVGPMTHTVEDCAIMLQAIAGHDERDSSSAREPVPDYSESVSEWPRGARVALLREAMDFDGLNGEVKSAVTAAADQLAEIGADVDHANLPMLAHSGAVFLATADVDAAAYHMPWLESRSDLYDWNTRTRLQSAAITPSPTYLRGLRARTLIKEEMLRTLEEHDFIVMPASPTPAPPIAALPARPVATIRGDSTLLGDAIPAPLPLQVCPPFPCRAGSRIQGCRLAFR